MKTRSINNDEIIPIGSKVIHSLTNEIGVVVGECLGFGKCKVQYSENTMWYPQHKRNIKIII